MGKHATHVSGNGHGGATLTKLRRLLAMHEGNAAAIRTTLDLLTGVETTKKQDRQATILAEAVGLDRVRRSTRKTKTKKARVLLNKRGFPRKGMAFERRQRTAALLDRFANADGPVTAKEAGAAKMIGVLVWRGYLKASGDGYVRTAKVFTV